MTVAALITRQSPTSASTTVNDGHSQALKDNFMELTRNYVGTSPLTDAYQFDVELTDIVISQLKRDKAACLENIITEHLQ